MTLLACLQLGRDAEEEERLKVRVPREDAWSDLELPPGHKDIVQSLIQAHFAKKSHRVECDLVRNKGS